ncbi:MAG: hypothetical protein ACKOBM_18635 [Gammaproteobacteria bacterium]
MRALALALALLLGGCSSDWIPFSSGPLSGRVTPMPGDLSTVDAYDVIRLETHPADPYSVKLWVVATDGHLYVHAGENRTTWVEHIEANPDVRLGFGDDIILLRAERVTTDAEFLRFSAAYRLKYSVSPRSDDIEAVYLFRLSPRSS